MDGFPVFSRQSEGPARRTLASRGGLRALLQRASRHRERQVPSHLQGGRAAAVLALGAALVCVAASAEEVRQIAPDLFEPVYRDPNAPRHKPPAPKPAAAAPKAAAAKPSPKPDAALVPNRAHPYGACAPDAPNFVACLGEAAGRADRSVDEAEHSVLAGLGARAGVNPVVADAAARGLRAAGDAWRTLRDRECADLALIENGLAGSLYERRLVCRIRRDVERVEFLRERYGARG
jgi:uncharacterized protein YecT (DUF1311 family)